MTAGEGPSANRFHPPPEAAYASGGRDTASAYNSSNANMSHARRATSPHPPTSPRQTDGQTFEDVFRSIANPAAENEGSNEVKRMNVMEKRIEEDKAALANEFPQYMSAISDAKKDIVNMLLERAEMMDFMQKMGALMKSTNARMFNDEEHMYLKQAAQLAKFYELFAPRVAGVLFPDMKIPVKRNIMDYVESSQRSKFMRPKSLPREEGDQDQDEEGIRYEKDGRDGRWGAEVDEDSKDRRGAAFRRPRQISKKHVLEASPSEEEDEDVDQEEADEEEELSEVDEEDEEEDREERRRKVVRKPVEPVPGSGCGAWDMGGYEEEIVVTSSKKKSTKKSKSRSKGASHRKKESAKALNESENLQKIDLDESDNPEPEYEEEEYREPEDISEGNSSDEFFRKKGYLRSHGRDLRNQRRTDLTSSHRRKYENARTAMKKSKSPEARKVSREPRVEIDQYKSSQENNQRRGAKERQAKVVPTSQKAKIPPETEEKPESNSQTASDEGDNPQIRFIGEERGRFKGGNRETKRVHQEKPNIKLKQSSKSITENPKELPKKKPEVPRSAKKGPIAKSPHKEVDEEINSQDEQEQIDMIMKNMARLMNTENPITSPRATNKTTTKPPVSPSEFVNYSSSSPIGQHAQSKTGGIDLRSKVRPIRGTSGSSRGDSTRAQKDGMEDIRSKAHATYNPSYSKVNGSPMKLDSELDAPLLEYNRGKSPKPRGATAQSSDLPPVVKGMDASKYENQIYISKKRHMYIALKDFRLPDKNYFPLRQGDVVCSVAALGGWYFVYKEENPKKFGFVPGNYLNIIR